MVFVEEHMSYLRYLCLFGYSVVALVLLLFFDWICSDSFVFFAFFGAVHVYVVMFVFLILELHRWCNG